MHFCRVLVATALVLASACKDDAPPEPPLIRPVRFIEVATDNGAKQRVFAGVSKAGTESRLSFRVDGRILELPVKVGDAVKKGQTIAKLDPADYQLQLQEARAAAAQARAQSRNAQSTYERTRALYENQNASKQELDSTRAQYDSSRASLASANQQVQLLKRRLDYTHLKAPANGMISTVEIEENENVRAGQQVSSLQVGEQIEVSVNVPQSVISLVKKGDPVSVTFDAIEGRELKGECVEVSVSAVQGGSTFPVTVRLLEGEGLVRAGMSASVAFHFTVPKGPASHVVPSSAVGEDRQGRFVFVLEPDGQGGGTVRRRSVEVGEATNSGIEIQSGLKSGELVVTAGVTKIQDGLAVRAPGTEAATKQDKPGAMNDGAKSQPDAAQQNAMNDGAKGRPDAANNGAQNNDAQTGQAPKAGQGGETPDTEGAGE